MKNIFIISALGFLALNLTIFQASAENEINKTLVIVD